MIQLPTMCTGEKQNNNHKTLWRSNYHHTQNTIIRRIHSPWILASLMATSPSFPILPEQSFPLEVLTARVSCEDHARTDLLTQNDTLTFGWRWMTFSVHKRETQKSSNPEVIVESDSRQLALLKSANDAYHVTKLRAHRVQPHVYYTSFQEAVQSTSPRSPQHPNHSSPVLHFYLHHHLPLLHVLFFLFLLMW